VDHGKSSLVLALTGTDPDRFPEEKARGLTIDLGFAFTTLPSGTEVGFVDVPGHVRFIKNMLAGVGAVEVALLVVDAGEGWMPQSEEHVRILELLDVRHGMVALTKADTVDAETLELAELEIAEHLGGSTLAAASVVVCDSVSGRGIDRVRSALDALLAEAPVARDAGRPRLWVDRVFSARGAGTVVTGTLTGGSISVDDDVVVGEHRARVRGIETAGRKVTTTPPGTRVALNLAGVEHRALSRGDAVTLPDQWAAPKVVDVALRLVPGESVRKRARVQVYVGSGERRAWLRVLDDDSRFARLRLDHAVPLAPGDRLVLRDSGRGRTVAGAEVLDVAPEGRAKDAVDRLALPLGARLLAGRPWLRVDALAQLAGCDEGGAAELADSMVREGTAALVGRWLIAPELLDRLRADAVERVLAHHDTHPLEAGLDIGALAKAWRVSVEQARAVLDGADEVTIERGFVRHRSHRGDSARSPDAQRLLAAMGDAPFSPPAPKELGVDQAVVRALVRDGALVDIDGVLFTADALEEARTRVVDALRARGHLTVAEIRDLLGSTRKFVVPLVGWLDREGVTRRRGDDRIPGPRSGLRELR
jgi:selenocysteine-specific elongation factor